MAVRYTLMTRKAMENADASQRFSSRGMRTATAFLAAESAARNP
jgi:hypothetical protein